MSGEERCDLGKSSIKVDNGTASGSGAGGNRSPDRRLDSVD
jgi:hypothetical protein